MNDSGAGAADLTEGEAVVVGIDPGKQGGIVAISLTTGLHVANTLMPLDGGQPCARGIAKWLQELASTHTIAYVAIEKAQAGRFIQSDIAKHLKEGLQAVDACYPSSNPPVDVKAFRDLVESCIKNNLIGGGRGSSARGSFSYGAGWGRLEGAAAALGYRYTMVAPRSWQKHIHRDIGGADTKERSITVCRRELPSLDLTPGRRRKAHDGLADAGCIALWGRMRVNGAV